jgi:outer membrane lipase/esterase
VAVAEADALTSLFNTTLQSELPAGTLYFNTAGLLEQIVGDPSAYGLTNATQPCFDATAETLCSSPNSYLFFDTEHPTTYADSILAEGFISTVTPEPASFALVSIALASVLVVRKRIHKA